MGLDVVIVGITAKPYILQKILNQWICCKCLAWWYGIKKIQPSISQQKKRPFFFFFFFSNWDFDLKISLLRKKVFMPTSKMYIRTLYVKRFRSSNLFVFSTLPQRGIALMNPAKWEILVWKKHNLKSRILEQTWRDFH